MRIVLAPQEFKGSLSSIQVCEAMANGVHKVAPDAKIDKVPLADGGPGTVSSLVTALKGEFTTSVVENPFGKPVSARWGRITNGLTAVIEMSAASGLLLLDPDQLDPRKAGTFGTGELILEALDAGVERMLIGVGGSATNDGGAGMATALGVRFLDQAGQQLEAGGAALANLASIDVSGIDTRVAETDVIILADVSNPLLGPDGASVVYGPQKGAKGEVIQELDHALSIYADIVARDLKFQLSAITGGGAAGGLAAGLVAFSGARIVSGIDYLARVVGLRDRIAKADVVITGEGRLDYQSAFGKTVAGVASISRELGKPCLVIGGTVDGSDVMELIPGITHVESATPATLPISEAIANAAPLVDLATSRIFRRYQAEQ